ncbi:MAG: TIGR03086 family metal-binding protein [Acidimicrobiales bacterium]
MTHSTATSSAANRRCYRASAAKAAAAFESPGALDAPCAVSYGPVPGSVYAGHRIVDVVVHGWELAVATDQDKRLEPNLVAACSEIVAPQLDALRASGRFGSAGDPPPGVDEQTRLLASLGRNPSAGSTG